MRRTREIILAIALVAVISVVNSTGKPQPFVPQRVTLDIGWDEDPSNAVREVARQAGLELLPLPELSGVCRLKAGDVTATAALDSILGETEWKFVDSQLLLVSRDGERFLLPSGSCRVEFVLEVAPADKVMELLKPLFPQVLFSRHLALNGFYLNGPKEDMLEIKRWLTVLDVPNFEDKGFSFPVIARTLRIRMLSPKSVQEILRRNYPNLSSKLDVSVLTLEGDARQVGEAMMELSREDRTPIHVAVSADLLRNAKPKCRLICSPSMIQVQCSEDCDGALQLTGLRNGDSLDSDYTRIIRDQPEWWIERDGKPYRILMEFRE